VSILKYVLPQTVAILKEMSMAWAFEKVKTKAANLFTVF
jgi:hypothetical protein